VSDERDNPPEHQWGRYCNLKRGDIYVAAGAYLCRYGRIVSKLVGPEGRVILIEPSPTHIAVIKEVVNDRGLTNVTLIEKAVWREKCRKKFCIDEPTSGHHLGTGHKTIEVEVDTVDNILDDLKLDHVDLFAADVENAEVAMVVGMEKWLGEKRIKNLAIAAYHKHPDGNYAEISEMLKEKGYRGIKVWGGVVYAHV